MTIYKKLKFNAMTKSKVVRKRISKNQKDFAETFPRKLCNVSQTCKAINISRETFYRWYNSNEKFKALVNDSREGYKDEIESKMYKLALIDENPTMLIWLSKTQLKDRGYVEMQEREHSGSDSFLEAMKEASRLRRQQENEQG